jgi:thiol-disulfide isomerase/thioredoxin
MKPFLHLFLAVVCTACARAEFSTWTRNDGKTAELDLISVADAGGEKSGTFKMRNGKTVTYKVTSFTEADAARLAEWKPAAPAVAPAASVFDDILDGNLLKLGGKSLKSFKGFEKPAKYYLFYYSASWCGPCHKFTPSLVGFYNKHKPDNHDFELVLITSDSDEKAMEKYASEFNMPWPQLKLSKVEKFKKEFKHPGTGIPNLVLTDLQGNLLKTSFVGEDYLGPTVVMDHLESLLKQ